MDSMKVATKQQEVKVMRPGSLRSKGKARNRMTLTLTAWTLEPHPLSRGRLATHRQNKLLRLQPSRACLLVTTKSSPSPRAQLVTLRRTLPPWCNTTPHPMKNLLSQVCIDTFASFRYGWRFLRMQLKETPKSASWTRKTGYPLYPTSALHQPCETVIYYNGWRHTQLLRLS